MNRGFEIVSKYADANLALPYRTTKNAAGYDFESAEDVIIPSIWKLNFFKDSMGHSSPKEFWRIRFGKS